ncbi:MAG: SLC13 family permease [Natrialbaceae archaeon]|nr:SLC13 family permease [Natrialbaceae archaeon]
MTIPVEAALVFGLIGIALVLFVTELIPSDTTAIGIIVSLALLEPATGVSPRAAISGFANPATVTIVAMFMLSAGIQRSGLVQRLGYHLASLTDGDERRTLIATVASTGSLAGFVNNTPVVAIFVPMITDLADRTSVSPSKLLLPLSFAAILGGTLTVLGTSTNILASDLTQELLNRPPIGMFEFTKLSVILLAVGLLYLITVGRWLTPERIPPNVDLVREFGVTDNLMQAQVRPDSTAIGLTVDDLHEQSAAEVRILQHVTRDDGEVALESSAPIEEGDRLVLHGAPEAIIRFAEDTGCRRLPDEPITEATFAQSPADDVLAKVVIPPSSSFIDQTIADLRLHDYHQTAVLSIKRRDDVLRETLGARTIEQGDTLLIQTTPDALEYFADGADLVPIEVTSIDQLSDGFEVEKPPIDGSALLSVGILAGVVATAATGLIPIVIAALAGVFAMIVSGVLTPSQAYEAVSWDIVFLLAGVIPSASRSNSLGVPP